MRILPNLLKSLRKKPKTSATAGGLVAVATVIGLAMPMIQEHEGLRINAYLDPVGIPTICFGETLGVSLGDQATVSECHHMLKPRLVGFLKEMRTCTDVALPAKTEAAFLSFTYNLGSGVYCTNIAKKRINKGKLVEACEALDLYVYAGGRVLRGLVKRRTEERNLCLAGLAEGR